MDDEQHNLNIYKNILQYIIQDLNLQSMGCHSLAGTK